jgi:hypothetical protein
MKRDLSALPSQQAVASADSTPPQASSITYTSSGTIDTQTGAFAPGVVTVTVNVSEPLLAVPFLSYAFTQGVPLSITLVQVGATTYQGSVVISDTTSNGTGTAVFSAHDLVNNQGNEIESGETILIDSQGPKVTNITTTPLVPIKNDPASPISVTANFTLSEAPKTGTTPDIGYTLSKSATTPTTLTSTAVGTEGKEWKVTFTLPTSAGGNGPENLGFTYSAKDALGNVQNTIQVPNAFQVYAGELPPLNAPSGLKAKALPHGHVALSWNEVVGAAAYQLFRKGPNDAALTQYGTETPALTFDDATTLDGDYLYAIASVRIENQQKGVSAPSPTVSVTADSIAPNAPQTLALQLSGQGVVATWVASGSSDTKSYALYRKNLAPGIDLDPTGLTPVLNNIISLAAIDSVPSELEHAYAVTAFDAAGNQSLPSNTQYLNFALLPVSSLGITLTENALPQITWSYSGNQTVKYKVILNEGLADSIVLYEGTSTTFVDSGYTGGSRQYTVYVIDQNQAVSVGRTLLLPDLKLDYPAELHLKRGIFNRLDYTIKNAGITPLTSVRLTTMVMEQIHHSEIFNLNAGEMRVVSVIVGGYAELGDIESVATTIEITPNVGETVEITNSKSATVSSAALLFSLETKDITSGATGLVRFSVENTSAVTTELITAKNNGANPSPDLKIELTDKNGNLFSTKKVQQFLGNSVITVGNGDTVARIEPGKTFTSDWIVIDVPASVPNEAKVILSVEKLHSAVGTANHIEIQGTGTSKIVSLVEPPYNGEFLYRCPQCGYLRRKGIIIKAKQ